MIDISFLTSIFEAHPIASGGATDIPNHCKDGSVTNDKLREYNQQNCPVISPIYHRFPLPPPPRAQSEGRSGMLGYIRGIKKFPRILRITNAPYVGAISRNLMDQFAAMLFPQRRNRFRTNEAFIPPNFIRTS